MSETISKILLSNISNDNTYKISKNKLSVELIDSVKNFGIFEMPILHVSNKQYIVVFGHNRISAAIKCGMEEINCKIIDSVTKEDYIAYASHKNYLKLLGVGGKVKLIFLMRDHFNIHKNEALKTASDFFSISADFVLALDSYKKESFFEYFYDYLDERETSFKTLISFMRLPQSIREQLMQTAYKYNIRVNIFKRIVDIVSDFTISVKSEEKSKEKGEEKNEEKNKENKENKERLIALLNADYLGDEYLLNALKEYRYPKYTSLEKEKNEAIKKLENPNLKIDFPEFFEGGEFSIILKCTKNKSKSYLVDTVNQVDENLLKKLSEML
jgi:hypothetical protein